MQLSAISLALTRAGVVSFSPSAFSPSALFASGAQGAWYDPSDYTTLFQDAAGTIPITSPLEKPVGLMLDKSKSGVGTNGAKRVNLLTYTEQFDNAAWTKGQVGAVTVTPNTHISPNGTITSDTITAASGPSAIWTTFTGSSLVSGSYIYSCSVIKGKSFNLTIDDATANGIGVFFNGTTGVGTIVSLGSGWTVANFSCVTHPDNSNYWLASVTIVRPSTTPSANIAIRVNTKNSATYGGDSNSGDTLVVWGADLRLASEATTLPLYQKITDTWYNTMAGNHAYQSTTTSRPTLSARYNLLTKTEDLTNAAWIKQSGTSVNATPVAAPNGTNTAWFVTGNGTSGIYQVISGTIPISMVNRSVYLRSPSGPVSVSIKDPTYTANVLVCNLTTNWQTFTLSENVSAISQSAGIWVFNIPSSGIEVAWPDIRYANDGVNLPAYQRVDTATDYDYAGFPPYLKFDGTDDGMVTGNIDFTGTDKMSVFAGVRKLSDSATGIVAEFSDSTAATGWFGLYASSGGAANYVARTKGSTENVRIYTTYTSPITNVVTAGMTTVAADSASAIAFRVNGADVSGASVASNISTGNYGTYPLYIGRRGGTTLPFNGRLYSLVVCGKLASDAEIASTETWVNGKTKAF